jgi:perosamine synthetase
MFDQVIKFIREIYKTDGFIPLHEPRFIGNEKKYLEECIDSTFVSSVGKFVDRFEQMVAEYTGAKHAVVCDNGTNALFLALKLYDISSNDEVITQPLTFIATANAISYTGAHLVFIDVDMDTMGLSPIKMEEFLTEYGEMRNDGYCYNKVTNRRIAACVPMHTFGHPCRIDEIAKICNKYNIVLVEDAAESIGSKFKNIHTGTFGKSGILSFNGNKTITTGGGGMILTNDEKVGKLAKHLTTQAKIKHPWEYRHDMIGYNYRMPNLNAALGCAQMEKLNYFIGKKRELAEIYSDFFKKTGIQFFNEPENCYSNYWLNTIILRDADEKNQFLEITNRKNVMTRPVWHLMNRLPMFESCQSGDLTNSNWFDERVVNIPSSVIN